MDTALRRSAGPGWLTADDCRVADLEAVLEDRTDLADFPSADGVEGEVLVYGPRAVEAGRTPEGRRAVQAELARALAVGPGVVVFRSAFPDAAVVDRATEVFRSLVAEQHASGAVVGDHFAAPGSNDRVWGALDKFALRAPAAFADYYANDVLALVSEAWLGAGYQVTSQVNVVNPGGAAQQPHRDYHLGFLSHEQGAAFPAHVHRLSPFLTLQGAVAHCDMPVETGPTLYLPHSQKYEAGYVASHLPPFRDLFARAHVQLPLALGDAAFFNPALLHGAGSNRTTDVARTANLLQVSSAFGRAMESVDRAAVCEAVFPVLRAWRAAGADDQAVRNVLAASAEGYAFPTNLDRDPPVDGLAPPAQAALVARALDEGWDSPALSRALRAAGQRRLPAPA